MSYIKIDRKILKWEWYKDTNTCRLFFHLLLKANWKDGSFQGVEVPRGSLATSYKTLAQEICLTERQLRTSLNRLKTTQEVSIKRHGKFSVISIKNYNRYQEECHNDCHKNDSENVNQNGALPVAETTTIEEVKRIEEGKEIKEKDIPTVYPKRKVFIPPNLDEVKAYCEERGNGIDAERFIDHYEARGWMLGKNKMKNWKAAVRTWERQRAEFKRNAVRVAVSARKGGENDGEWTDIHLNEF